MPSCSGSCSRSPALAFLGLVKGGTNLWFTLPEEPRMVRRESLVGGSDRRGRPARGRAAAHLPSPARAGRNGRGTQGPAGRACHGSRGGSDFPRVAGGWGKPRPRGRTREDGGRARNLGLGAAQAQTRTCARRTRSAGCPPPTGACCPLRSWLRFSRSRLRVPGRHASPTRWSPACWRPRSRSRCTFRSRGRRSSGLYALPSYKYEDWQLLAAIPLGLVAGAACADHDRRDRAS